MSVHVLVQGYYEAFLSSVSIHSTQFEFLEEVLVLSEISKGF
jgi:hypothetical protein